MEVRRWRNFLQCNSEFDLTIKLGILNFGLGFLNLHQQLGFNNTGIDNTLTDNGEGTMQRSIIRNGFILLLISMLAGFLIPAMEIPRLGLSAHTIGLLSGALLIAIGSAWPQFRLTHRQQGVMFWTWLYSSYVNWLAVLIGALLGTGKMTPVASGGMEGSPATEGLISILLITVALTSVIAAVMSLYGLRGKQTD
ncbi:hypothetical protein KQI52_09940 [bacterium]|nr:hypothetical protein [bacterium]